MKKALILLMVCFCFISANAAYLRNIPMTVNQPDGTVLHCFASGDEFFNYLHDENGYTIMKHPQTGYYVYAEKRDGQLVATEFVAGRQDPASKGLQPYALISPEEWMAKRRVWEVPEVRPQNRDYIPNHGTLNNISIFIRFSDDEQFANSYYDIDNMFNDVSEGAISLRSYFRAASYGAIEIPTTFYPGHNGETIISYQDIYPHCYFEPYDATTNPNGYQDDERTEREFALLERAVNYVNSNYPVPSNLNIDYDNDGYVDNVCFIVKGGVGAWNSLLWPHKWALFGRDVYINGKRVWTFNFQLADASSYFNTSTMCHEMNHSLSAPDLYHYSYSGPDAVGIWDLMHANATPPQHCGAYMKMKYGHWIDEIPEITQAGTYTLNPISSPTPTNIAYKISTEDPNQFYVLEYRDNTSLFETALPGSGLLIYRINTSFSGNADYNPDEGIYDEVYIFRPGGSNTENGNLSNAYFSSDVGRTMFNSSTIAYPFFTDGTPDMNFRIHNITSAGSTISFTYDSSNELDDYIYIGDGGTNTNNYIPSYSYYNYSLTQQIYTAEEIGTAGTINSIAFYNDGATKTRNCDFYLIATDKTSFDSNTDWVNIKETNKVFSGTVNMVAGKWTNITFDKSFVYDGISNLILVTDDNSGEWTNSPHMSCRVFNAPNQAIRIYNDNLDYDPTTPQNYTGTILNVKNQIKMQINIPNGETFIVGEGGTNTSNYLPSYSYFKHAFTQQIYTADEIGTNGIINSIGFYNDGATKTRIYDFYLLASDRTSFASSSDWVAVTDADKVFSGIVTMSAGNWTTIVFEKPFIYDGLSNLVLVADDNSGEWTYSPHMSCRVFDASEQTLCVYSDGTNYDPMTLENYTGTVMNVKNQIRMHIESADELYVIGDKETTTNNYLPSYSYYNYSLTQQIYTADEIGTSGIISSIAFYNDGAKKTRDYDFYLVASDKTSFANGTDWVAVTEENKVFSGTVTMTAEEWTMIEFDKPYVYDGTSNLILVADDNSGEWTTSPHMSCRVFNAPNQAIRIYNDNLDYDPTAPQNYTGTIMNVKNQIMMHIESAGELLVIGDGGTATNNYLPSYSYYNYSLTQQIYTADEIGAPGTINSMAFYNGGNTKTRTYNFYLVNTDKNSFESNNDWVTVTAADMVFSGTVTMTKGEWTMINFNTPFEFDGTSNLVLVTDDNSGEWTNSPHMSCRVFNASNQAIRVYSDPTDYDPYNPSGYNGSILAVKNQIIFGITPSPIQQTITLSQGWNWFSTYIEVNNPVAMLDMLKEGLGDNAMQIQSAQNMTEYDSGDWFGDLDDLGISNEQTYMIEMSTPCTVELQGMPANPANHVITINHGWNWIGFPCTEPMDVVEAFAGFEAEEDDQIMSQNSMTEFDGEEWFGDLETLEPGQGLMYFSNSIDPKVLVFQ